MSDIAQNRESFWKNIPSGYYENNTSEGVWRKAYIRDIARVNKLSSVLELGCNSGGNLLYIIKKVPNIQAVGLDICENALAHGKKEGNRAQLLAGSIYDLSRFEKNSFDMVFTSCVLIHIPPEKIKGIIKEMKRISKFFTIHMEHHSEEECVTRYHNDNPHRWAHNYIKAYDGALKIRDMERLAYQSSGGDSQFMWWEKTERELKIIE